MNAPENFRRIRSTALVLAKTLTAAMVLGTVAGSQSGSVLRFDGSEDFVSVPFDPSHPTECFTVSAWIRVPPTNAQGIIVGRGEDEVSDNAPWSLRVRNGTLVVVIEDLTDANPTYDSGVPVDDSAWHHVAATRQSDNLLTLYIDGLEVASFIDTLVPSSRSTQSMTVGCHFGSNGSGTQIPALHLGGCIDEVTVWNVALPSPDVSSLLAAPPSPTASGLVALWLFDEGSDQVAFDSSLNQNHGTLGATGRAGSDDPLWSTPGVCGVPQDWYVDISALGCATGTGTQSDPFCSIMDAVGAAFSGDTIHIAQGSYLENVFLDNKSLTLIGTEGRAATIIDGSGSGSVVMMGGGVAATMSGLTLTNGTGFAGGGLNLQGGNDVHLVDCSVVSNTAYYGGGIAGFDSGLTLTNTTVSGNTASGYGGGILSYGAGDLTLVNTTVSENSVMFGGGGGGIASYSYYGSNSLTLTNSLLARNSAAYAAAIRDISFGYYGGGDSMSLVNSTVTENVSFPCTSYCGNIITSGAVYVANSIIWNNVGANSLVLYGAYASASVNHSLIEGGWSGVGNTNVDPLFRDPLNGDYRVLPTSPCIDAGNNFAVPAGIETDLHGLPRFIDDPFRMDTGLGGPPTVDLGAFEFLPHVSRLFDARGVPVLDAPPRVMR